jgi:Protein of unknown function (DUF998)
MMRASTRRVLTALAIAAPLVFTVDWVLLGLSHRGYSMRTETISALSAHNAPGWALESAGGLVLATGFVLVAVLLIDRLGARAAVPALFFGLSALGTAQASVFRTICFTNDGAWCTPLPRSAYPSGQWLHGVGTGVVFTSLLLACLSLAWVTRRIPDLRDLAPLSVATAVVCVPAVVWFLRNVNTHWHGFAEKVFLFVLAAWTSYTAFRIGTRPDEARATSARDRSASPGQAVRRGSGARPAG